MKRLSTEDWAKARALWETDSASYSALARQFGIGESSIRRKATRQGWRKGAIVAEVERRTQEKVLDLLSELSMGSKDLLGYIAVAAKGITKTLVTKAGPIEVPDNEVTFKYRELLVRLLNLYPAPKAPVKSADEDPTERERREQIERLNAITDPASVATLAQLIDRMETNETN